MTALLGCLVLALGFGSSHVGGIGQGGSLPAFGWDDLHEHREHRPLSERADVGSDIAVASLGRLIAVGNYDDVIDEERLLLGSRPVARHAMRQCTRDRFGSARKQYGIGDEVPVDGSRCGKAVLLDESSKVGVPISYADGEHQDAEIGGGALTDVLDMDWKRQGHLVLKQASLVGSANFYHDPRSLIGEEQPLCDPVGFGGCVGASARSVGALAAFKSGPARENEGGENAGKTDDCGVELFLCPADSFSVRLYRLPLYAQVGFVVILGLPAIGVINFGC
ncbi:hypothetical protein [Methylobacterium nigriterrae]|uniref:hypothetical protein n=1 Tax=Methylobacterium nigriterrae TaxID=3127512 RepID=UPI003013AA11